MTNYNQPKAQSVERTLRTSLGLRAAIRDGIEAGYAPVQWLNLFAANFAPRVPTGELPDNFVTITSRDNTYVARTRTFEAIDPTYGNRSGETSRYIYATGVNPYGLDDNVLVAIHEYWREDDPRFSNSIWPLVKGVIRMNRNTKPGLAAFPGEILHMSPTRINFDSELTLNLKPHEPHEHVAQISRGIQGALARNPDAEQTMRTLCGYPGEILREIINQFENAFCHDRGDLSEEYRSQSGMLFPQLRTINNATFHGW